MFRQAVGEYLGENPPSTKNIKMLTFGLLGMMNWLIYWYSERGEMNSNAIAKVFWDLFSHGA